VFRQVHHATALERALGLGFDRVYEDLKAVCAGYRIRFDEWPTMIELHPLALQGLAELFDGAAFERLAERLEFRTSERLGATARSLGRCG
jgi:hypothetical protein